MAALTGQRTTWAQSSVAAGRLHRQLVGDVAGVRKGTGEPVELGHDNAVASTAGSDCFSWAWSSAVGAGEPVIDLEVPDFFRTVGPK